MISTQPQLSPRHCVLVTHLPLTDLRHKAHGTFRRLCLIAQAMQRTGLPLVVVTGTDLSADALPDAARRIVADLRDVWGVHAAVRLAPHAPPSRQRWLVQQLKGATGYGRMASSRTMLSPALYDILADEVARGPAFFFAHRLPSMFALSRFRGSLPNVYFDMDDVEHVVWRRELANTRNLRQKFFLMSALPAVMLAERRAVRTATATFVCSSADAQYLASLYSSATVKVLPNAAAIPVEEAPSKGQVLLMVGAYTYGPNADGANFLLREILPLIVRELPNCELWLVGVGGETLDSRGAQGNVRILGFVEDIAAVYAAARVVVCPIRYGGGTRVKLIEAAAWGKAIVTTTLGAEGLPLQPDRDALFGDTPQQFAAACVRLMRDDVLCERLGRSSRAVAIQNFDRERIIDQLAGHFGPFREAVR